MRAAVIVPAGEDGGLSIEEVPDPVPARGEIVVSVEAAGINRADLLARRGRYPVPTAQAGPAIAGMDVAGTVVAVGPDAEGSAPGDRVMAMCTGTYAELVAFDARLAMPVPDTLGWEEAAALPLGLMTEVDALVNAAAVKPGESVLVSAAGSGVGALGVQLARVLGAGTVIGTARTTEGTAAAQRAGADEVLDSRAPDAISGALAPSRARQGIDVVIDHVGGESLGPFLSALRIGGRLVSVGRLGGRQATFDLDVVARNRLRIVGTTFRTRSADERAVIAAQARGFVPAVAEGHVRPQVARTYRLEEALTAQEDLRAGKYRGKLVLRVAS